tara:strand:- start:761 stop:1627 length:867 start_codon:yes stop_codon:yes gene_type:complete
MTKKQNRRKTHRSRSAPNTHQRPKSKTSKEKHDFEKSSARTTNKGISGDVIEGRQAVRELLLAGKRKVREVIFLAGLDPSPVLAEIRDLAAESRVPVYEMARSKFDSIATTESPQGVVSFAEPLQNLEIDDLLSTKKKPFILVLDGIVDPRNLGAILRSAECAGVTGVLLPRHRSTKITPTVAKTAQGAIEHLPIASVSGIPKGISLLKEKGVWTVGLDTNAQTEIYELGVADEPLALVLGSEGKGLGRLSRERCDLIAKIPIFGSIESLNVSVAAAIACFEIAQRRR